MRLNGLSGLSRLITKDLGNSSQASGSSYNQQVSKENEAFGRSLAKCNLQGLLTQFDTQYKRAENDQQGEMLHKAIEARILTVTNSLKQSKLCTQAAEEVTQAKDFVSKEETKLLEGIKNKLTDIGEFMRMKDYAQQLDKIDCYNEADLRTVYVLPTQKSTPPEKPDETDLRIIY